MVIDFHTHTFPDKIAEKTIEHLSKKGGIKPYRDGTYSSLKKSMQDSGVDVSIVLPVATNQSQVETINNLSAELSGKNGIYYFGAIHPDCSDVEAILDDIKAKGLKGIKLHPDYQGAYFDDPKYIRIIGEAAKRELITVTHAGRDVAYPEDIHCTPDMVLNVLSELKGVIEDRLVLAHMGGFDLEDEVLEKLIGKPVYMDTAAVLDRYPNKCKEIIEAHGADRILFATDSPWTDQANMLECLKSLGLSQKDNDLILYKNAKRLLGSALAL